MLSSATPTFRDDLKQAVGRGADVVFDTVGGLMFAASMDSLAPEGRRMTITVSGGTQVCFDLLRFHRNNFTPQCRNPPFGRGLEAYAQAAKGGGRQVLVMP
jgi:NADPH:quinone reductase-like Zn-dependent oxidoreductase